MIFNRPSGIPVLTDKQAQALVRVSRSPSADIPPATHRVLERLGLIRHTFNEFIFSGPTGSSTNAGFVLTPLGERALDYYRPAKLADLLEAFRSVPLEHRTPEVVDALRRLDHWKWIDSTTEAQVWTRRAVSAA